MRKIPFGLALLVAAAGAVTFATLALSAGAGATTAPNQLFTIKAIVNEKGIALVRAKDAKPYITASGLQATFTRGSLIRFRVLNKGGQSYMPALHALDPQNGAPFDNIPKYQTNGVASNGRSVNLEVNFYYRGKFLLVALVHGKPVGKPVSIVIK